MSKPDTKSKPSESEREFLHDLSSPLMVALGRVDRLASRLTDPAQRLEVEKVVDQLKRIQALIESRREQLKQETGQ